MTGTANSTGCVADRLLNDVLQTVHAKHHEKLDKLYINGLKCQDPETAPLGRARRSFWLWLCDEYPVKNGGIIWMDLHPEGAPAWVQVVMDMIAEEFPGCAEVTFTVRW